jgi:hypothetical protein
MEARTRRIQKVDNVTFDGLTRSLVKGTSRRGVARVLVGGALAAVLGRLGLDEAAACVTTGRRCGKGKKCCNGAACKHRRCGCPADVPAFIEGGTPVRCPRTGDINLCARRVSGNPVCLEANQSLRCQDCATDADCPPLSDGRVLACVRATSLCDRFSGTACAVTHV